MRRLLYLIPLFLFIALAALFVLRLTQMEHGDTPDLIPSPMIGKPAPEFDLPPQSPSKTGIKTADLHGQVTLINFFASWCVPCRIEHPLLSRLAAAPNLRLIGIAYKNDPEQAQSWLAELGNPYAAIASDRTGRTGIDFGVYGVPESYLIDRNGIIRFKQTGPLTPDIIENKILPLAKELNR